MDSNNKRIAKNTLVLYFRMIFAMLVGLYTSRVILEALGVVDYGIYNVVGGIVSMFGFLNSAMTTSTQRYITYELGRGDKEKLQRIFSTSVNIHLLIAIVVVLLAETIGLWFLNNKMTIPEERQVAALWVYHCSVLSTAVLFASIPYNSVIVAHEKMSAYAYISIFDVTARFIVAVLISKYGGDRLVLFAILLLLEKVLVRIIYGIYCGKYFEETKYLKKIDTVLFKEILGFSSWNFVGALAGVCTTQGINIVLNMFFGPVVNAARAVAVQVQNAATQFATNFQTALNPQIIKYYATGDLTQMHKLIYRSSRFSFYLMFGICLPIFLEAEFLLSLWLKEVPEDSVLFLRLILCVAIMNAVSNPLMVAAQATGKIRVYQTVIGCILIGSLPLGYFALKVLGEPEWAFIVEIIVVAIAYIVRIIMVRRMINMSMRDYLADVIVRISLVTIISSVATSAVDSLLPDGILYSCLNCCLAVFMVAVSSFFLGMTSGERGSIIENIKNMCTSPF